MKYEHHSEPLLEYSRWIIRLLKAIRLSVAIVAGALLIGVFGYHFIGELSWIDAFLESSMILGGMGAVAPMTNDAVKLFASFYALLSGFIVLTCTSIVIAPMLHRLLHHFHAKN